MARQFQVGDTFEIKFFCNDGQQNGINVLHYNCVAIGGGGATDADATAALSAAAAAVYIPYLNVNAKYAGARGQIINPGPVQVAQISTAGNGQGVRNGDCLPPQVAFLLSPRTATAGRNGRGRVYLPFWAESESSGIGVPNVDAIDFATAWSTAMFAQLNVANGLATATLSPVILSRRQNKLPVFVTRPVTNVVIRQRWASQRRRSLINRSDTLGP